MVSVQADREGGGITSGLGYWEHRVSLMSNKGQLALMLGKIRVYSRERTHFSATLASLRESPTATWHVRLTIKNLTSDCSLSSSTYVQSLEKEKVCCPCLT